MSATYDARSPTCPHNSGPYTIAHNNFGKSGQHNGTLSRFLNFLQQNGSGDLYASLKRVVIMFIVMRVGSDIPGMKEEGMLGLTLRIIPAGAGFDEAGGGMQQFPGSQQSPGSASGEDGDGPAGKRRKKNVCADTRFLCDHIKGLTDSISRHGDNERQRGSSTARQVGQDVSGNVANRDVRQSIGNAEFQALECMETRVKAIELLKRSYAQDVDAESETGGRDNPVYVRTKRTYDNASREFERAFGSAYGRLTRTYSEHLVNV